MNTTLFNNLTEKDKSQAVEELIKDSTPHADFFLMVMLSVLMATFGLLLDSPAIIIGSMLIAPILYPVLSLSLGIVMSDQKLMTRSFTTIIKSMGLGIATAAIITILFSYQDKIAGLEIISRTQPSLLYSAVAVVAGLAASFALVKPHLNETLPGIAISVAIIPPLAVVGIGIASLDISMISNSLLLFAINALGIIFASMIIFSMMNLYIKRKIAHETIKKEEKKLEIHEKSVQN